MIKNILGSLAVFFIIIIVSFLFDSRTRELEYPGTPFPISTIEPKTPQDYILLGQKIDVNTASAEILDILPGVGPSVAKNIVDYRTAHGRFNNIEELVNVKGVGEKTLERLRIYLK